jgi:alpha-L-rhamnosidase
MIRARRLLGFMVLQLATGCAGSGLRTSNLRCEYRANPLGMDSAAPRLSWVLSSKQRGQGQTAYEIQAATDSGKLADNTADLWDSGRIESADSIQIPWNGKPLQTNKRCFWHVRVWDRDGRASAWSDPAEWTMGILSPADWRGEWIGEGSETAKDPLPIFRKEFTLAQVPRRAVIYICGLGQFELRINGRRVGNDFLQPGWTDYRKTCLYSAYDVTSFLKPGANAIGVSLGNGMFNVIRQPERYTKFASSFGMPEMIAQVFLEEPDGHTDVVASDETWKTSPGPITFDSIYGGEDYDARLEQAGWDQAGFDDSRWNGAEVVKPPGGQLAGTSRSAPAIKVAQTFQAVKVTTLGNGDLVYDLGQNCSMVPVIAVQGDAGATVQLLPAELLNADGSVSQRSSGKVPAWDTYTLAGKTYEIWSPIFNYRGCRYIQVHVTGNAKVLYLMGMFVTSTSPSVGEFACSNELFNRTDHLIEWAIRSNMVSVLTDCPHRERLGWLEQDHLMGPSILYGHDVAALLTKICGDIRDDQHADGLVADIAPEYVTFKNGFLDSPEWGSACVLLPWNLYEWYGDLGALRDFYESMRRYVDYLGSKANDNIISYGLGDWYDLGPKPPGIAQLTPVALTATAFYYRDLCMTAQAARLLGHGNDAQRMETKAAEVAEAFNRAFYHPAEKYYATDSQTANAVPVVFGLAPPEDVETIVGHIVADMRSRGNALTAGDVGYRFVLQALADHGQSEEIFKVNNQSTRPGYGYQLAHRATSLTEAWDANPTASQNHFMLGHILEWFYRDLAGIQPAPGSVAFNRVWIKPAMVGDISWVRASYHSIRGPIRSEWKRDGTKVEMRVSIPPGVSAEVFVPAKSAEMVRQSGAEFSRMEGGSAVFEIQSGDYVFETK